MIESVKDTLFSIKLTTGYPSGTEMLMFCRFYTV